jgi:outer membrane protein TolC
MRPDLLALTARKKAAERALYLARREYYPTLFGSGGYRFEGEGYPLDHGWTAGVTFAVNIFNGWATREGIAEAQANVRAADARIESLKLSIGSEIQNAYLALRTAAETLVNAEAQITLAKENLDIVTWRYEAGVGNPVEVSDAMVGMSNAKLARVRALYEQRVAGAALEKAMGTR